MDILDYFCQIAMYPFRSIRRFVALSLFCILFLALFFPLGAIHRDVDRRRSCSVSQRYLWRAMQMYMQDSDGKFPRTTFAGPKSKGWKGQFGPDSNGRTQLLPIAKYKGQPVGWVDALIPYYYSESVLACPAEPHSSRRWLPYETYYTDYYMNKNLSEKYLRQLVKPESTIVFGEGSDGTEITDATYARSSIPATWLLDRSSPALRHYGGAIYLMADGSTHWLTPDEATHFGGRKNSFAVRE